MLAVAGSISASPVAMAASANPNGSKDLLIVGPGVLGAYAGKLWKDANPSAKVVGVTNTESNHAKLAKIGISPATHAELAADAKFPYVLFSAPPSGSPDYPAAVAAAVARWDSSAPGGSFVFTSSMSVCAVDDGSQVTEECPLVPLGGPQDKLLLAEQAVLKGGGNVVRLVGLYHAQRGAHTYFLKVGQVPRPGDNLVNLLHYEDAAALAVAVLAGAGASAPYRGRVFLGCDNHPVTFRDMMDACTSSGVFKGSVTWMQPDQGPNKSKRTDNSATRAALGGWAPKYASFVSFMAEGARDWYNTTNLM